MEALQELADGLTGSVREELSKLTGDRKVRDLIGAAGLADLVQMSRSVAVTPEGALEFATDAHEARWREWEFGTSGKSAVPISRMVEDVMFSIIGEGFLNA